MSDSLADLFSTSSPPRPQYQPRTPSPSPPPLPAQHDPQNPLFLSPTSTHATPLRSKRPRPPIDPSIQPSDLQGRQPPERSKVINDDEGLPPLPPALPPRVDPLNFDLGWDPLAGLQGQGAGGDGAYENGDKEVKKRRVVPKIDSDRLLGERGFPALMKAAKKFKCKGKGHEIQDLKSILSIYQMWAHGMFPKGDFRGTISRVENICRTRRMEVAMKGLREAFYPPARSPTPTSPPPSTNDDPNAPGDAARTEQPEEISRNQRSSEPLFDTELDEVNEDFEEDGPDMEELMAMEEMEREAVMAGAGRGREVEGGDAVGPPVLEEEDEWGGLYD